MPHRPTLFGIKIGFKGKRAKGKKAKHIDVKAAPNTAPNTPSKSVSDNEAVSTVTVESAPSTPVQTRHVASPKLPHVTPPVNEIDIEGGIEGCDGFSTESCHYSEMTGYTTEKKVSTDVLEETDDIPEQKAEKVDKLKLILNEDEETQWQCFLPNEDEKNSWQSAQTFAPALTPVRKVLKIEGDDSPPFRHYKKHNNEQRSTSTSKARPLPNKLTLNEDEETTEESTEETTWHSFLPNEDDEDSWQSLKASAPASTPVRKVLKIEGDNSPPFRNYNKEQHTTSTSKEPQLPNKLTLKEDEDTTEETTKQSFLPNEEETKWRSPKASTPASTPVRKVLNIEGDDSPPFRNYKNEQRSTSTFKELPLPNKLTLNEDVETKWQSFLPNEDKETSSQSPKISAPASTLERKVLKIEGDDSPPFRNYKKEQRSTSTFKELPLPNKLTLNKDEESKWQSFLPNEDEETSWQSPKASAPASTLERKVLKIEGDDSPPFRNYKKHNNGKRSTSAFKARPLPNMSAPPSIQASRSLSAPPNPYYPDVPLGPNLALYRFADDSHSASSKGSIRSSASRSSTSSSFRARPMPKFNDAPKVPVKPQRGPMRSEWAVSAKWETACR